MIPKALNTTSAEMARSGFLQDPYQNNVNLGYAYVQNFDACIHRPTAATLSRPLNLVSGCRVDRARASERKTGCMLDRGRFLSYF